MINEEEAEAFFKMQERELSKEMERQSKFITTLEQNLIALACSLYPRTEVTKPFLIDELKNEAHNSAVEINELVDFLLNSFTGIDTVFKIEQPVTQKRKWRTKRDYFLKRGHDKAKEIVFLYFPEIVNLPSYAIRHIDFTTYCTMLVYRDSFYFLLANSEKLRITKKNVL